jgi:hypothetical protein
MLLARLGAALGAWLSFGLRQAYRSLQIPGFLEAPVPSLFHIGSRTETCKNYSSLPPPATQAQRKQPGPARPEPSYH